MFNLEDVTEKKSNLTNCDPSYDDLATCDPDSGWCQPNCPPSE